MTTDPLADLLTRIRNALPVNKKTVSVPYSKQKKALLDILKNQQFISGYQIKGQKPAEKTLEIELKYHHRQPAIIKLQRLSKPGIRLYANQKQLPKMTRGRGIIILSTSKGLLTAKQAIKQKIGGELICRII